jgi:hypothetical protein
MKSLEEILKALAPEDSDVVKSAIQTEKDKGIDASRNKGKEVEKHLTELNRLRDFLRDDLEFDLDEDLKKQLEEARKTNGTEGNKATELEKQVTTLSKQVKTLTDQLGEKDKLANDRAEKLRVTKLTEVLRKSIGAKVHSSDYVIKGLIRDGAVKLLDDEETAVFVQGGEEVEFDKGVQEFLKKNADIVKNDQNGGGGSTGDHKTPGEKIIRRTEFEKLTPSERSAKVKEGYKLTD